MNLLFGIDIGTSSTKVSVYNKNGVRIDSETYKYSIYSSENLFAEQNPEDWVLATYECLKAIMKRNQFEKGEIKGISFSGQMHGLVMLNEQKEVIHNSIIWCDQRSEKQVAFMKDKLPIEKWLEITGNTPFTSLTAAKLLWVKDNLPKIYKQCYYILTPKDYVRYRLTNEIAIDITDASGTQLLDLKRREWSKEICNAINIDMDILPRLIESTDIAGYVTKEVSLITGIDSGIPVIAGAGDQQASAIGNGIIHEGSICDTLGTSGVVFSQSNEYKYDSKGRVNTFIHSIKNSYCIMGVTQASGLSIEWFTNQFYKTVKDKLDKLNKDIKSSNYNKILFLPYLMGERTPHLNPHAKGAFFGIDSQTKTKDLARACMEGVSFSQIECFEIIKSLNINIEEVFLSGGGSKSPLWSQMISDALNIEIKTNFEKDTSVFGAAIIAAIGVGIYKDFDSAIKKMIKTENSFIPNKENHNYYQEKIKIFKELYNLTEPLTKLY